MLDLNQQQQARSISRLHRRARTSKDYGIMMLIKNIGKRVKFIGSKYIQESLINMSLQRYISYLNKHIVTLHNVSLRLLRSVNTLNSKVKFKTILINKSQLLLKGLYLEATWTFLRFAAETLLDSSTRRQFLSALRSYMLHIPNSAEGNYLRKPHAMSEKRHKPKNLRFTKM